MKIIKPGCLTDKSVHRGTCQFCGCVIEFERWEARFQSDQRDGDALIMKCPTCNREIWCDVKASFVHRHMAQLAAVPSDFGDMK